MLLIITSTEKKSNLFYKFNIKEKKNTDNCIYTICITTIVVILFIPIVVICII